MNGRGWVGVGLCMLLACGGDPAAPSSPSIPPSEVTPSDAPPDRSVLRPPEPIAPPAVPTPRPPPAVNGWTLRNPSPDIADRTTVFAVGGGAFWTVDLFGTELTFHDGQTTRTYDVHAQIHSIWGTGPNDVWAVGDAAFHWDGATWTKKLDPPETLKDVFGLAPDSVWVVGFDGAMFHWNGTDWSRSTLEPRENVLKIWGSSRTDVWILTNDLGVVGTDYLRHWNGRAWTLVTSGYLFDVWGSGPKDVWLSRMKHTEQGYFSRLDHFDGTAWTEVAHPESINAILSLWGSGPNDLNAVAFDGSVLQWNGTSWSRAYTRTDPNLWDARLFQVSGAGEERWAVGDAGVVLHRATAASPWVQAQPRGDLSPSRAGQGIGADGFWRAQGNTLHRHFGAKDDAFPLSGAEPIASVWGPNAEEVWVAMGSCEIHHLSQGQWAQTLDARFQIPGCRLESISGSGQEVWAAGSIDEEFGPRALLLRWNGSAWTEQSSPISGTLWTVHVRGSNEVWLGGSSIASWNGTVWRTTQHPDFGAIRGFWSSGNELWAVGNHAWRWNGAEWKSHRADDESFIGKAIWGRSPTEIYMVGDWGAAAVWDGSQFKRLTLPVGVNHLNAVFGAGPTTHILGERGLWLTK